MTMRILILGCTGTGLCSRLGIHTWANFTYISKSNVAQLKSGWHCICCGLQRVLTVTLGLVFVVVLFVLFFAAMVLFLLGCSHFSGSHLNLLHISFSTFFAILFVLDTLFLSSNERFCWHTFVLKKTQAKKKYQATQWMRTSHLSAPCFTDFTH